MRADLQVMGSSRFSAEVPPAAVRVLRGAGSGLSVRQRLLGLVLVAALAFSTVTVVAALSSSSVGRSAAREHRVVALQERYLRTDTLLAKVRGQVYEVASPRAEVTEGKDPVAEYAELRQQFDELLAATLRDVPQGPLLPSAQALAAGGRAVLASGDAIVTAAPLDPETSASRLSDFDAQTDALDEPFDALIDELGILQQEAVTDTRSAREAATQQVLVTSALGVLLLFGLALLAANSILRGLRSVERAASRLADGDFSARFTDARRDEIGALGQAFNATADSLKEMLHRLEEQRRRDTFGRQLNEALEMADTEEQTYDALSLSLAVTTPNHPTELLVADSSRAHLERRAEHPDAGAPGCPVESPFGCVAVRRGTTTTFADSRELNACPKLRDHGDQPLSAVCVPVTFMGRALGVLHTTSAVGAPPSAEEVVRLTTVAAAAGARIGTVRSFERTQLQASTDGLTGLMNRRTFETTARPLVRRGGLFVVVMADVDHFKHINDTFGHEAGDRALTLLAEQLRAHLRNEDLLARYGGEEFVMLLAGCTLEEAVALLDRFRARLAHATGLHPPAFTVSFGIVGSAQPDSLAGLIRRADAALYRAKTQGRDRVMIDDPGSGQQRPQQVASALERALREDDPLADTPPLR